MPALFGQARRRLWRGPCILVPVSRSPEVDQIPSGDNGLVVANLRKRRISARRIGDFATVMECLRREIEISPDLLMPRVLLARNQARLVDGDESERALDFCLNAAVGSHQLDHGLIGALLLNVQQSPNIRLRSGRFEHLLEIIESASDATLSEPIRAVNRARVLLALRDRQRFLNAVNEFSATPISGRRHKSFANELEKVAQRWSDPSYPQHRISKIFVIGLSRTGTSSMDEALGLLGFSHLHWRNHLTGDLIRSADLFLFDAFSDIGIAADFETLAHQFPTSRFILTTRSIETWEISVRRHYRQQLGILKPDSLRRLAVARTFGGLMGEINASLYSKFETWGEAFESHHQRVDGFFSGERASRLLRFNVLAGASWAELCSFLGVPMPDVPYPHANPGQPESTVPLTKVSGKLDR